MAEKHPCDNCDSITTNPRFCSRSCAALFLNRNANGRKIGRKGIVRVCKICGKAIGVCRRSKCDACLSLLKTKNGNWESYETVTKKDLQTNDTQTYRRIRYFANLAATKAGLLDQCHICGYRLYVECCHKKSIGSFSGDTLVGEINDTENLVGLCPNHHWEFDNGYLHLAV